MTARALLPRLLLLLVIVGAAAWLAFHRDQLDPALLESDGPRSRSMGTAHPRNPLCRRYGVLRARCDLRLGGRRPVRPAVGNASQPRRRDARRDRFLPHRALCCCGLGEIEGWWTSSASRRRGGSRGLALCCLRASCPAVSVQPAQLCARPDANPAHPICSCVTCLHGARHACLCLVGLRWAGSARRQPVGHQLRSDCACASCRGRLAAAAHSPPARRS